MRTMRTLLGAALSTLLVCQAAVSGTFLNEAALAELAEREGYQLTLQAIERVRRQASECQCPPPPSGEEGDGPPPPPPCGPPPGPPFPEVSSSEEGDRPRGPPPPPPPPGCWPPPPPPPGPHHHHHHHRGGPGGRGPHPWGMEDYSAPACELRPLFRVPNKFNFTARIVCFERWELSTAESLGMSLENRFDPTRYRPTQRKPLMWNKGCDMQCHFMEMDLLAGDDQDMTIKTEAVAALMKEEGDSSDIAAAIDKVVETCVQQAAELVHPKQVCRSGADEVLFCLQRTIEETCPGAKWQGQRSCDEVADAGSKVRACRRRMMFHGPPPRFGPPPFPRPAPVMPNSLPVEGNSAEVSESS